MLKMSEALRLGIMLRPNQAFGAQYIAEDNATCAIGAIAEAIGILDLTTRNGYTGLPPAEWGPIYKRPTRCPQCRGEWDQADEVVIHLNNRHRWSRERIARWLERFEETVPSGVSAPAQDAVACPVHP